MPGDRANLWKSLVGGSADMPNRKSRLRSGCKGRRKHHQKNDDDTCEKIRFKERIRQKVVVKIMKPKCLGECQSDSSDSTCEVETFCAHYEIPVVAKIKKAECASSCK